MLPHNDDTTTLPLASWHCSVSVCVPAHEHAEGFEVFQLYTPPLTATQLPEEHLLIGDVEQTVLQGEKHKQGQEGHNQRRCCLRAELDRRCDKCRELTRPPSVWPWPTAW
jgi:hypothetical protein